MPETLTIRLTRRIAGIRVLTAAGSAAGGLPVEGDGERQATAEQVEKALAAERARMAAELDQQKARFDQLCRTVGAVAGNLDKLYHNTLAENRADIARLSIEIARRILRRQVALGNYDIQAIIEEVLQHVPTRQDLVIFLNPEDLSACRQRQQEDPEGPFTGLEFAADGSVGRGECLVETPKGVVKSFIEEHLERISEALEKVE